MIIEDVNQLKQLLLSRSSIKICILDNNSVEFLTRIETDIDIKTIFDSYDLVLVPQWVRVEIEDSEVRKGYIERLSSLNESCFCFVNEQDYSELINNRDADLFRIFCNSCGSIKPLESFIKRSIIKGRPIEELVLCQEKGQIKFSKFVI